MKPIYKRIKVSQPFCSICKDRITGNGSMVLPYKCSCGKWRLDIETGEYN